MPASARLIDSPALSLSSIVPAWVSSATCRRCTSGRSVAPQRKRTLLRYHDGTMKAQPSLCSGRHVLRYRGSHSPTQQGVGGTAMVMRIGLIGAGVMGSTHAQALSHVADARIVAVADPMLERAGEGAALHNPRAYP